MPLQPQATVPPPPAPLEVLVPLELLALPVVVVVVVAPPAPPLLLLVPPVPLAPEPPVLPVLVAPPVPALLDVLPVGPAFVGLLPHAARRGTSPARASVRLSPRACARPPRFELMSLPSPVESTNGSAAPQARQRPDPGGASRRGFAAGGCDRLDHTVIAEILSRPRPRRPRRPRRLRPRSTPAPAGRARRAASRGSRGCSPAWWRRGAWSARGTSRSPRRGRCRCP